MTQAICLKCGAFKTGAFVPCPECGHLPQSDEDKARHLILTGWYFQPEKLEQYSKMIRSGQRLEFGEETLAMFITYVRTGHFPPKRSPGAG